VRWYGLEIQYTEGAPVNDGDMAKDTNRGRRSLQGTPPCPRAPALQLDPTAAVLAPWHAWYNDRPSFVQNKACWVESH
jgi:hypothetical protein